MVKKASITKLVVEVKAHYKKSGRHDLPWRKTHDPYKILVSEVMLQQTQVVRVVPFYDRWIQKFPTAKKLADAKLSDVLKMWSGLGYNRRAKYLWDCAKILSKKGWQEKLPGVGPYTAAAVEAFAHNNPTVFIETNIRTVFFYFDGSDKKMSDKELFPLIAEALKKSKMPPREFYWALMDYGSYLKGQGIKLNSRSKHYVKQSKFEGSRRQKRATLLRKLLASGASEHKLEKVLKAK
jgi:A/G-specific adenine glycosylase